ncbi:MAG: glycosyltransferase family 2 protein [Bryobacteraceae bacterium]
MAASSSGKISAIIPSWNRADLLRGILPNLRAQTRPPDEILVVDNGSSDGSAGEARELGAEVISLEANCGFAGAVNEGIRKAAGEWLLILNNDVVLEPDWLEVLLAGALRERAWFAAGKLLNHGNSKLIDGTWDLLSRAAYAWRCGYGRPDSAIWSVRKKIAFAPMTAAIFHRSVFEQIGLLETRFESYYEDVDFGVRCAVAGFTGIYEPGAVARHMGKATLGKGSHRVFYLTARNQVYILAKHYSGHTLRRYWWAILVGQMLGVAAAAKHGHFGAAIRGKWDGLKGWKVFRSQLSKTSDAVEAALTQSERAICDLQREIGFDPYWRVYFSLTRGL